MKFHKNQLPSYDLTYNDVFLLPNLSKINSRLDVDLSTHDGTGNTIPLISANMTAVTGMRMAETLARRGGLSVLPQDIKPEALKSMISNIKKRSVVYDTPITLSPAHTIHDAMSLIYKRAYRAVIITNDQNEPLGVFSQQDGEGKDIFTPLSDAATYPAICLDDKLTAREMYDKLEQLHLRVAPIINGKKLIGIITPISALRAEIYRPNLDIKGKLKVAVAMGINGDIEEKTRQLIDAGADIIVLDTAHGHQQKVINAIDRVKRVDPNMLLAAGNVVTKEATRDLINAGADIVKVGVGPGAMCTTRMMTGVGRPQFSAVVECSTEAKRLNKNVWADGGVKYPRDVALALAAGASNVMIGSWFAGTYESAADIQRDENNKLYKTNFGMASKRAVKSRNSGIGSYEKAQKQLFEEGVSTSRMYINPSMPGVEDIIDHILAGVRSACTYSGALNIPEFNQKAVIGVQLASGYNEGMAVSTSW